MQRQRDRKRRAVEEAEQPIAAASDETAAEEAAEAGIAPAEMPEVGANLRRVRSARSMSLDTLARASGVSRAMLSQIELGHSVPTIKVLWKVARALDLPFSALISGSVREEAGAVVMRAERAKRLTSHDGRFSSRALFPPDRPRRVEFYELRLAGRGREDADPHPPGTTENLVVQRGAVQIEVAGASYDLDAGDAIQFQADAKHSYRNSGATEAVMFLVMSYPDAVLASPGWNV